ncbi:Hsp20/alpha crystallin family protein [Bacillus tianshenii]|nr:Hsp20/alpha crystallin family protein [Bacillus tianshenii]
MTLTPYDPFKQWANMRKDFERFFSELPQAWGDNHLGSIRVDVHETEKEVIAKCDIPGLEKKEDVHINVDNHTLSISGSVNRTTETNENNMYRKERYAGSFQRSLSLPSPVSQDGVKATYKNGVLEVRMPKLTPDTKKKIDVEFN